MPAPLVTAAGISALGGLAASGLNAISNSSSNAQNIREQRRINEQMIDYSKNAYTYATADRLRAGLSPIDASPAETPALTAAQAKPNDWSGIANGLSNAVAAYQNEKQLGMQKTQVDAQSYKDYAEGISAITDAAAQQATIALELDKLRAEVARMEKENEYIPQELRENIRNLELRNKELQTLIDKNNQQFAINARNEEWYSSLDLPNGEFPNNAFQWAVWDAKQVADKRKRTKEEAEQLSTFRKEHRSQIYEGIYQAWKAESNRVNDEAYRSKDFKKAKEWSKTHPRPTMKNVELYESGKYPLDFVK